MYIIKSIIGQSLPNKPLTNQPANFVFAVTVMSLHIAMLYFYESVFYL